MFNKIQSLWLIHGRGAVQEMSVIYSLNLISIVYNFKNKDFINNILHLRTLLFSM